MANEKVFIEFSDQRIKTDLTDSIKQFDQLSEKTTSYGKITEEAIKKAAGSNEELAKKIRSAAEEQGYLVQEVDQMKEKQREANREIANSIKNYKVFGVSINDIQAGYRKYALALGATSSASSKFVTVLKVVRLAMLAIPIFALVAAFGSLIAFLTRSQKGVDLLARAWGGFSAGVTAVIDRLSGFGEIVAKVFTGEAGLKDLVNGAKDAVRGLGDEITREAEKAAKLIGVLQGVRDAERDLRVERSQANADIEQRRLIAADETKTLEERTKALKEASALEASFIDSEIELLTKKLNAQKELNKDKKLSNEEEDEFADLQINLQEKIQQSYAVQTSLVTELNSLRNESIAQTKAQREEIERLNATLEGMVRQLIEANQSAQLELKSPLERARAEYELTIQSIEGMEAAILQAAKAAGRTVDVSEEIAGLIEVAQAKFRESVDEIRESDLTDVELLPTGNMRREEQALEQFVQDVNDQTRSLVSNYKQTAEDIARTPIQRFTDKLKEAFDLNDGDLFVIQQTVSTIFSSITDGLGENIQNQLDANQQLIDSIKERRDTIEDELDQELKAAQLGYANNVTLKKKELDEINEAEKKALAERAKLQRQQARQQIISEAAQQASGLATTAITLLTSGAKQGGLVGFGIAIAAVAALFKIFSSIKAQAAQATKPVRLYRGGSVGEATRDFGMVKQRGGKSDVPGRNNGHMVEGTNLMLGGHEWVNNEEVSQEHRQFLEHLNTHPSFYRGVDIRKELANRTRPEWGGSAITFAADRETIATKQRQERNDTIAKAIVEGIGKEIRQQTGQLITHDERKDQYHFLPDGKMIKVQRDRNGITILRS